MSQDVHITSALGDVGLLEVRKPEEGVRVGDGGGHHGVKKR